VLVLVFYGPAALLSGAQKPSAWLAFFGFATGLIVWLFGVLARIIHERLQPSRGSFPAMRRQASSAMHPGIAVVGLPGLTEKSLAGTRCA
jgi:hypothetical protein